MNNSSVINCGVPECGREAQRAAILGTLRFCLVPAMEGVPDPLPLVRFNLCGIHLTSVRRNFTEVVHDPRLTD